MLIGKDEYLSEAERNKFEKSIEKRQKEIREEKQEKTCIQRCNFIY
jgi:type II restriction enzyme